MANPLNVYPNLPGMLVEFRDGGLQLREDPNPAPTDSVLLIGTALDGPIMEPVALDTRSYEALFGRGVDRGTRVPTGATLPLAFEEAYADGCRDLRMMRISGSEATAEISMPETELQEHTMIEEELGTALGNEEANFTLNNHPDSEASVQVLANGNNVSSSDFDVDIGEMNTQSVTDEELTDSGDQTTFEAVNGNWDDGEAVSVSVDGDVQDSGDYVIDWTEGTITFNDTLDITETVTASYTYFDGTGTDSTVTLHENAVNSNASITIMYQYGGLEETQTGDTVGEDVVPWVASGPDQVIELQHEPDVNYAVPILLVGGVTEVTPDAFDVDETTLTIFPGFLPVGVSLVLRYIYLEGETLSPSATLRSYFGGDVYNYGAVTVEGIDGGHRQVIIEKPESKKANSAEAPRVYTSNQYPTLRLLAQAINEDANNGVYELIVNKRFMDKATRDLQVQERTSFSGGNDGLDLTPEQIYDQLEEAYHLLENYTVDYIVPLGITADTSLVAPSKDFANQLALACAVISHREHTVQGVIPMSSPDGGTLREIRDHVDDQVDYPNRHIMKDRAGNELTDSDGDPFDIGRHIYVLAGPDRAFQNPIMGRYTANSAAAFAGFISDLPPNSSAMNKQVGSDQGLRFEYSNQQRNALVGNRFVCYKIKGKGTPVEVTAVEDEITAALRSSDYASGSVTRQVKFTVNRIMQVVEPFLGEAPSMNNQNALNTEIDKVINDELVGNGILMPGSTFELTASLYQRSIGESSLTLSLVPSIVRRRVNITVELNPA